MLVVAVPKLLLNGGNLLAKTNIEAENVCKYYGVHEICPENYFLAGRAFFVQTPSAASTFPYFISL